MRPAKGEIPNVFSSSCGYVWIKEMELRVHRDIFDSISPLDHRYCASSPELCERLSAYLSEAATIRYQARVEAALVRPWLAAGSVPAGGGGSGASGPAR